MTRKLILFLFVMFFSCDLVSDWSDPDNPYEYYQGRMVDRIRIEHNSYESDYIYYDYDRRGRITLIENTYYGTIDTYDYDDDIITVRNNIGVDRDMLLEWHGYAEYEIAYINGYASQSIEYDYLSNRLWRVDVEEYYYDGSLFSEESYSFDYDDNDNLSSIERYYKEEGYYISSELTFSSFSNYENNYNIDILSVLGLCIDDDFASQIGRTGEGSKYLPYRAILKTKRNGRYDEDVYYSFNYIGENGIISAIEITTSLGVNKVYHLDFS